MPAQDLIDAKAVLKRRVLARRFFPLGPMLAECLGGFQVVFG